MYIGRESAGQVEKFIRSSSSPTGPTVPSCTINPNADFVGNDIANRSSRAPGVCCEIYSAFSGCNAFSWTNYNDGTC